MYQTITNKNKISQDVETDIKRPQIQLSESYRHPTRKKNPRCEAKGCNMTRTAIYFYNLPFLSIVFQNFDDGNVPKMQEAQCMISQIYTELYLFEN